MKVGLVTCRQYETLPEDDAPMADLLRKHSYCLSAVPWNDNSVRWQEFDLLILRSCWDYYNQPSEFSDWIRHIWQMGVRLLNPPETVLWNMNKFYLQELQARGLETLPTRYLERGDAVNMQNLWSETGWKSAVIKPAVSAMSHKTYRCSPLTTDSAQELANSMLVESSVLIQEYWEEVETDGELSLIYFDREFSHSVLKRPAPGDFRVQKHFGGTHSAVRVSSELVEAGRKALDQIVSPLLYARVDGLVRGGRFAIMEVELIEPVLFFGFETQSAERFVHSLARLLQR